MKSLTVAISFCLLEAGLTAPCWAGPASDYYVTGNTKIYHIRGDVVLDSWNTVQAQEFPIVVLGNTVRTGSYYSGNSGHEYSLAGSWTGATYPPTIQGLHHDGTTDGVHNYTTSYWGDEAGAELGRAVWRTDSDWTNPVKLFDTVETRPSGITYDPSNNTLWVSEWDGGPAIRNYTMNGTLLSSFSTDGRYATSVALDPVDGTLWMGGYENTGYFYQYSRAGVLLSSTYYSELAGERTLGGEIAAVPEPSTYAMMLTGIGLIGFQLRRRNHGSSNPRLFA
jgi:hypothetical protein